MSAANPRRITKAPVSVRAVIGRLNRKLAKQHQRLHKTRAKPGLPHFATIGEFFIVDERTGNVIAVQMDSQHVEQLAREQGALAAWEEMTR